MCASCISPMCGTANPNPIDVAGIYRALADVAPRGQRAALRAQARTHDAAAQMRKGSWRGPVRAGDSWRLQQRDALGRWV